MSILSSLQPYTDANGLICPQSNPAIDSTNNGLLYTAEAIVALMDNGELTPELKQHFMTVYGSCEVILGLMKRLPDGTGGQEGPDDYYGCGAAAAFCDPSFAQDILNYSWLRNYNNENPGKFTLKSWMGRFPHLMTHLKLAAGQSIWNPFERAWWAASLMISALVSNSNAGAWCLSWLQVRVWEAKGNGLMEKLAVKFWRWRFNKNFGNPGNMLGQYFQNPNHPLALALQNSK